MTATVTSRGRVTLPQSVRDLLGIKPGSVVDFQQAPDGRIVLVKVDTSARSSPFAGLRGHAGAGLSTDEIMALTRGDTL
jgi:antitoxin PrlF